MVAAMNAPQWDTASVCGMCVEVSGPKGAANKVVIRIVDKCPECKTGDLDLSPQAFDMIAEHSAGRVQISWQQVACSVSGGLQYHFKDGSSQYWMAVQVRNSRFPVKKIELQQGQSWTPLTPVDYGYYIKDSNPGPGPFTFRVTSTTGDQITESGVILGDNTTFQGSQHF
jgi:expansin (peptidoglycan-binding protein)